MNFTAQILDQIFFFIRNTFKDMVHFSNQYYKKLKIINRKLGYLFINMLQVIYSIKMLNCILLFNLQFITIDFIVYYWHPECNFFLIQYKIGT